MCTQRQTDTTRNNNCWQNRWQAGNEHWPCHKSTLTAPWYTFTIHNRFRQVRRSKRLINQITRTTATAAGAPKIFFIQRRISAAAALHSVTYTKSKSEVLRVAVLEAKQPQPSAKIPNVFLTVISFAFFTCIILFPRTVVAWFSIKYSTV